MSDITEVSDYYYIAYRIGNEALPDRALSARIKSACLGLSGLESEKSRKAV